MQQADWGDLPSDISVYQTGVGFSKKLSDRLPQTLVFNDVEQA